MGGHASHNLKQYSRYYSILITVTCHEILLQSIWNAMCIPMHNIYIAAIVLPGTFVPPHLSRLCL